MYSATRKVLFAINIPKLRYDDVVLFKDKFLAVSSRMPRRRTMRCLAGVEEAMAEYLAFLVGFEARQERRSDDSDLARGLAASFMGALCLFAERELTDRTLEPLVKPIGKREVLTETEASSTTVHRPTYDTFSVPQVWECIFIRALNDLIFDCFVAERFLAKSISFSTRWVLDPCSLAAEK